jgi:hypothetical protein
MLLIPPSGLSTIQTHVSGTTDETATFSISVTAHASANTKGGYTALIAATTYASYGVMVQLAGLQTAASANQRCLVDIALGGEGSEVDVIPNLTCGNVADYVAAAGKGVFYYFPIYIPAGARVSARCQASTGGDIVNVAVRLFQHPSGAGAWYGHRVTAYGADTTNSRGTSVTPAVNAFTTVTAITASTACPIRYLQMGFDLLSDTTGASTRMLARIILVNPAPSPIALVTLVDMLPIKESTTIEAVDFTDANFILSHMRFNLPAASALRVAISRNAATPEARGVVLYGVD